MARSEAGRATLNACNCISAQYEMGHPRYISLSVRDPGGERTVEKSVDLSLGWSYAYADEGNGFANLNGWYGALNWEATSRSSMRASGGPSRAAAPISTFGSVA